MCSSVFTHRRKNIGEAKVGLTKHHSGVPPSFEKFLKFRIFVDADACPVKQEVYRVAKRYGLRVTLVAGSRLYVPDNPAVALEIVGQGMDMADNWIVERVETDDIVITGDIPLAARCLKKGAFVLSFAGKPLSEDNIGPILATRDLLSKLRETGEITGGPAPFQPKDRSRFLRELDETIGRIRRSRE